MQIEARRAEYRDVEALRELFRQEANCPIVRDSFLSRGLADPSLILVGGRLSGYGAVANKYDKDRLVEFYTLPDARGLALPMCRELLGVSRAMHAEAQSNIPLMLSVLYDCAARHGRERPLPRRAHHPPHLPGRHYNPPYGDVFMEVADPARRRAFGSYLVQEVKRACYEAGRRPAARCDSGNVGSRKTLDKAGFLPCGRLLVGEVVPSA
jgi:GNAT superfamily N-acetyltransferase